LSSGSIAQIILDAIWFVLPAYVANGGAMLTGGGPALDGGRFFLDGRRILGDGVTVRGTVGGIVAGAVTGGVQGLIGSDPENGLVLGLLMGAGAMIGDSAGSFLKRRLGLARGRPAPGLDQLGFLIAAIALASLLVSVPTMWFIVLIVLTPTIHLFTNFLAYRIGIKEVWY